MLDNKNIYTRIRLHVMVGTINKLPLILPDAEANIYNIVKQCFANQMCEVSHINGAMDHVHIIFSLPAEISLTALMNAVLSESSSEINNQFFKAGTFRWSPHYSAFSISESQLQKVAEYVKNQKEVHKEKSFQKEFDEFLKIHSLVHESA